MDRTGPTEVGHGIATMADRDLYRILGISADASREEIKKAYRNAAMKYHPDRNPDDPEAEERFKEAAEAYSVLGDPERRARYDRFGDAGVKGQGAPFDQEIFADFSDILGDFFGFDVFGGGRGRRGRTRRARRGASLRTTLELDLEEAALGAEKELRFRRRVRCPDCDGTGSAEGAATTCPQCGGIGQVQQRHGFLTIARPCARCGGTGQYVENPCSSCRGDGAVEERASVTLEIPAGVDDGTRLRLRGEGEAGDRGAPRGDLEVVVRVREHDRFARQGRDLYTQVPVSFPTAALGGAVEVETLDGDRVRLDLPAGTQTGDVFEVRGRGISSPNGGSRGDLKVAVQVLTPRDLTPEQKVLIEQLAEVIPEPAPSDTAAGESWWDRLRRLVG